MSRSRLVTLVAAGILVSVMLPAPVGRAAPGGTQCMGWTDVLRVDPGLSMSTPTSGIIESVGPSRQDCFGPMDGHQPTGTIKVFHSARYGYIDPDTCGGIEAKAYAIHSVPTKDGVVKLRNNFTASANPLQDGVMTGAFEGDKFSGRFWLRPLEGDCVTSPMTLFEGMWQGTWHGSARRG